jgi:hypothetical protein
MLALNASYQTGLQLLVTANAYSGSNANASGTNTATNAGTNSTSDAKTASNSSAKSLNSADGYSSASTIAALKAIQSTTSGPEAGVMAAIIASISNSNDLDGNSAEAGNAMAKANAQLLTSQAISNTLLSGGSLINGLTTSGNGSLGDPITLSLKDIENNLSNEITAGQTENDLMSQWLRGGMSSSNKYFGNTALASMTSDQIQQIINTNEASVAQEQTEYAGMSAAAANGTLKIQRATDVQGLDYVDAVPQYNGSSGGGLGWASNGSCNGTYLEEHARNSYLTGVMGAAIYLSW